MRGAAGALRGLGVRGASGIGARIGGLGYAPLRIRLAVVREQIAKAFPEFTAERVDEIARLKELIARVETTSG